MQRWEELWAENCVDELMSSINGPELTSFDHQEEEATQSSPKLGCSKGPKGGIGKLQGVRRRSRASKKVPTTLLKADANNFRALVQQFTGYRSASPLLMRPYKGPINLNFKHPQKPQQQQQHEQKWMSFFPLIGEGMNNVGAIADEEESFVDQNPTSHSLTYDDVDKFWGQELELEKEIMEMEMWGESAGVCNSTPILNHQFSGIFH